MGLIVRAPLDLNQQLRAIDRAADRRTAVLSRRITNEATRQILAGDDPNLEAATQAFADLVLDVMVAAHLRAIEIWQPAYALSQTEIDKALRKAPKYVREAVRELYGSVARSLAEQPMSKVREALIQQAVDNGKLVGLSEAQKKKNIRAALKKAGIALDDSPILQTVLWTQGAMAYNAAFWNANSKKPNIWGYQYVTQQDERVRDTHRAFEPRGKGVRYPVDDVFWRRYAPPNGWRCFLPGTTIDPIGDVDWISKSWYAGETVEIYTAQGHRLSVTANHPVATPRGWVAAAELQEGDDLFCNRGKTEFIRLPGFPFNTSGAVTYQQRPAVVDDIFESLSLHGRRAAQVAPLDFHGDGQFTVGEIDVVFANRKLMQQFDASTREGFGDGDLARPDERLIFENGLRSEYLFAQRTHSSATRFPSGGHLSRDATTGLLDDQPLGGLGFGRGANPDGLLLEESVDTRTADGVSFRQRIDALAPLVSPDHVVRIRRKPFLGHVFNLQSETGFIIADGVLASNCRCYLRPIFEGDKDARKLEFKGTPDVPASFQFNPGMLFQAVKPANRAG